MEAAENRFKYTHLSCPSCEHKGCFSINEDWSGYCFSCKEYIANVKEVINVEEVLQGKETHTETPATIGQSNFIEGVELDCGGMFGALTDRGISEATAKRYGVKIITDTKGKVSQHIYPYFTSNEITASKIRYTDQKFFSWKGSPSNTGLFGQQIAPKSGKFITLVEGECDAMAGFELFGGKWPVVSIKSGAAGAVKDVKESLEFLEGYDSIVICFDNDKPGRQAARKVARILKPGTARIMSLPNGIKDPNEMLSKNAHSSFVKAFWEAKIYTPSGVVNVSENRDKFKNRERNKLFLILGMD